MKFILGLLSFFGLFGTMSAIMSAEELTNGSKSIHSLEKHRLLPLSSRQNSIANPSNPQCGRCHTSGTVKDPRRGSTSTGRVPRCGRRIRRRRRHWRSGARLTRGTCPATRTSASGRGAI
ncbi:hypothetical protein F5B20DRAFT_529736 [Whalleya microplaca]|nr:hypothetical protein F5B20DRAFT_529736 [Whalleya microplaca]